MKKMNNLNNVVDKVKEQEVKVINWTKAQQQSDASSEMDDLMLKKYIAIAKLIIKPNEIIPVRQLIHYSILNKKADSLIPEISDYKSTDVDLKKATSKQKGLISLYPRTNKYTTVVVGSNLRVITKSTSYKNKKKRSGKFIRYNSKLLDAYDLGFQLSDSTN